jgi:hypothetical protein
MKDFVKEDDLSWDAYTIGTIMMSDLKHFLPDNVRGDDALCEMHRWGIVSERWLISDRDRVHQVAYLRNSIAHNPKPSLAEGVASVAAMLDVLKDHEQQQAVEQMIALLREVRAASWLATGEWIVLFCDVWLLFAGCMMETVMKAESFAVLVLEQAMADFGSTLGNEIHTR